MKHYAILVLLLFPGHAMADDDEVNLNVNVSPYYPYNSAAERDLFFAGARQQCEESIIKYERKAIKERPSFRCYQMAGVEPPLTKEEADCKAKVEAKRAGAFKGELSAECQIIGRRLLDMKPKK